jgi:hypothetical protein
MLYPVTPTSSVDAVQASVMLLLLTAVVCTAPGAVGAVWSLDGGVVTVRVPLGWETFPAASRALT